MELGTGSGAFWAWMIWTSAAMLFVPAFILTIKLELDDLRSSRVKPVRTREEEVSEHSAAA